MRRVLLALTTFVPLTVLAQHFALETQSDSLHFLLLQTGDATDRWCLPYPVYRLDSADIDGNGITDAVVGVVKRTRFMPDVERRIFVFKNHKGLIRPLWMGSRLGGHLQDFRCVGRLVRALETSDSGVYVVADYAYDGFGLSFVRYHLRGGTEAEARRIFLTPQPTDNPTN